MWRALRRSAWTVRKTLWFWLIVGQPTRWQTHWRKWGAFEHSLSALQRAEAEDRARQAANRYGSPAWREGPP